jgi:hypothetical protein
LLSLLRWRPFVCAKTSPRCDSPQARHDDGTHDKRSPSALCCSQARSPGAGACSTYTRCCSTQRGTAAVRATRQCFLRCFRLRPAHLRPPRPGPPRLTGTQAAQPPAKMRTHRANARAISLRIRAAAREPALSRIHNSSSCRVPLSPREHHPLISTTALGLSTATHSLSLLQSLGSPPTPLSFEGCAMRLFQRKP